MQGERALRLRLQLRPWEERETERETERRRARRGPLPVRDAHTAGAAVKRRCGGVVLRGDSAIALDISEPSARMPEIRAVAGTGGYQGHVIALSHAVVGLLCA